MSDNINLSSFPSSRVEALAYLYTQNQDLKGKTPTEITKIYLSAYDEIHTNITNLTREIRHNKSNTNP